MHEYDDEQSSWRDALRLDQVNEFLCHAFSAAEIAELDLPHVVVCRDEETGAVSYSGPFRDGMAALVFAEGEQDVDRRLNDGEPLTFSVAALYPAERHEPADPA